MLALEREREKVCCKMLSGISKSFLYTSNKKLRYLNERGGRRGLRAKRNLLTFYVSRADKREQKTKKCLQTNRSNIVYYYLLSS